MGNRVVLPGRVESAEVGGIVAGADAIMDDSKGKVQSVINSETDAELLRLESEKQDNITVDTQPVENSGNPISSGAVYAADKALSDAIEAILLMIPSAASVLNKLADVNYVQSAVATATAAFKGTYNLVSDLHLSVSASHSQIAAALDALSLGADANDYCFVQVPTSDQSSVIEKTERYKFNGTSWAYEYDLNNSGFTSDQWAAINSNITAMLVSKLIGLPTSEVLASLLASKQDSLTFDNTPTAGSNNPVKSGGIYARNNEIVALIDALDQSKQDNLTFDQSPVNGSTNPVTSGGVYQAVYLVQVTLAALDGRVASTEYSVGLLTERVGILNVLYQALSQSDIIVGTLPATGVANVIYRVPGTSSFADWMYYNGEWVKLAEYTTLDGYLYKGVATPSSSPAASAVKMFYFASTVGTYINYGGIVVQSVPSILKYDGANWSQDVINTGEGVFDISVYNAVGGVPQPYSGFDTAVTNANVPPGFRKGGMSIKFIQGSVPNSDNKYVQFRLMSNQWSTHASDWYDENASIEYCQYEKGKYLNGGILKDNDSWGVSMFLPISSGDTVELNYGGVDGNVNSAIYWYDISFTLINGILYNPSTNIYSYTFTTSTVAYIRIAFNMNYIDSVYVKVNGKVIWKPLFASNNVYTGIYTITKSSIQYPLSRKLLLDCVVDMNVYSTDESVCADKYYLVFLGYYSNRIYLGVRSKTDNTQYYGTTYKTISDQPSSGVKTYGFIFANTKFVYANLTIDWSKYDSFLTDERGNGLYKDVEVKIKPFSLCKMLIGEDMRLWYDYSFSDVNIVGDKASIYVERDSAKIRLIDNASISNVNFVYVVNDAISSRQTWEDGHGNLRLVPLISDTELENDNIGLTGVDTSFFVIPQTSNQCSVTNCRFEAFPRITIIDKAQGRHLSGDHAIIENNTFIRCYNAIYLMEEFARISQNTFQGCVLCVTCASSDITISECKFLQSDVCLYFRNNNDSYGFVNDSCGVHCGKAFIWAHSIPSIGFQVNNCQIMQAPIICKEANALSVSNCWLNTYFIIDSGARSRIVSNMMAKNYATIDNITDIYNVPNDTQIQLNRAIRTTDTDAEYNWNV